jgi:hypothetical protein
MNRANGPEDRSLAERCLGGTLPNRGAVYQIVQSPGQVGIYHDSGQGQGFVRVVPVSGSAHAPHIRFWNGDARGRWEGETLVVDITNFPQDRLPGLAKPAPDRTLRRVSEQRLSTRHVEDATMGRAPDVHGSLKKRLDKANQVMSRRATKAITAW